MGSNALEWSSNNESSPRSCLFCSRGYQGSLEDFFAEYQFDVDQKALNRTFTPSYGKFDGDFSPNSKFDSKLTSAFTSALESKDYDGAKQIIEGYQSSSFEGNTAKAKTLNEQLDNAIKGITDTVSEEEKETTSNKENKKQKNQKNSH